MGLNKTSWHSRLVTSSESVKGIILSDDRKTLLMIMRRDVPVWVLPGGGIEPGETPEDAVVRELKEETGFTVAITKKIAEYTPQNRLTRYTHFYECAILGGAPQTGLETRAIEFFDTKALPKKIPPPFTDWIQDALSNPPTLLKKPITSTSYVRFLYHLLCHPILMVRFLLSRFGLHVNTK